jgi:hypothetical protein
MLIMKIGLLPDALDSEFHCVRTIATGSLSTPVV